MQMGLVLKEARQRRGLKQRAFARLSGVDSGMMCRYESGIAVPTLEVLSRMAEILGTEASALVAQAEGREAA